MSVYLLCSLLWGGVYLRSIWAPLSVGYLVSAMGALISLLPLSASTLQLMAPEQSSIWMTLSELISSERGPLGQMTMSVTPVETVSWLTLQGVCLSVAYVAYHLHRERTPVLIALGVLGPALTCYGLAHAILGLQSIYGLYESLDREALTGFVTPVINKNSAASVTLLSGLCALGVGLHKRALSAQDRQRDQRPSLWLALFALSALGVFLSGSRVAQVCLITGSGVIALRARATRQPSAHRGAWLAMSVAGVTLALTVVIALEWRALSQLILGLSPATRSHLAEDYPYPRLLVWADCWSYLQRYGLWGTGRGSFGEVYMSIQSFSGRLWISHPESHPIQQLAEGGALGLVGGVLIPMWAWIRWWRRSLNQAHLSAFGLWVGLGAVGIHQLCDFGFEYLGLSVPVAVGWGLLWSYLPTHEAQEEQVLRTQSRRWRLCSSSGLVCSSLLLCAVHYSYAQQELRLREAVIQARVEPNEQAGLKALMYHPASAHLSLELLTQKMSAWVSDEGASLSDAQRAKLSKWLRYVKRRGPRMSSPYQIEARLFREEGHPALASLSYSLALNHAPWRFDTLMQELKAEHLMDPQLLIERLRAPYIRTVLERFGPAEVARLATRSGDWRGGLYVSDDSSAGQRATLLKACAQVRTDGEGASLCVPLMREMTVRITQALRAQKGSAQSAESVGEAESALRLDLLTAERVSQRLGALSSVKLPERRARREGLLERDRQRLDRRAGRWGLENRAH